MARDARAAAAGGGRIAVATPARRAWWLAGVVVQGRYGLPILQLTENVDTVAAASGPDDIVRGLGNWIFTSTDGASTGRSTRLRPTPIDLVVRLATVALPRSPWRCDPGVTRVRGRALLAWPSSAVATVVGVGAAPLGTPSPYGRLWRRFSDRHSIGLALRNTPRVVPVLVLGRASRWPSASDSTDSPAGAGWSGRPASLVVVAVASRPVARHGFLSDDFERPEEIPDHWYRLAADLDATAGRRSRVLELPGSNFAAYEWGNTVEPVLPGLVDRPTLAREVLPAGAPGTTDLLRALDRRVQHGTLDDRSLAPVARLLAIGDIVIRGDLDAARFGLADASAPGPALPR